VYKNQGLLLNSRLYHNAEFSATLVAGFLSGISSWENVITTDQKEIKGLDEMKYGSFTVTLKHGNYLDIAAFSRYPLSASMTKRMQTVVNFVEEKYSHVLENFDGEIGRFDEINEEIDNKLGTNHQGEFTVNTKNATYLDLTPEILAELDRGAMLVERFYLNDLLPIWKEKKLVKDDFDALVLFSKFISHEIFIPVEKTAAKSIRAETNDLLKKTK